MKSTSEIRLAIANLSKDLPGLYVAMEDNQSYYLDLGSHRLVGKFRNTIGIGEQTLADGSLVVPEKRAAGHLARMIGKSGLPTESIKAALKVWEDTPAGEEVPLTDRISIKKWNNVPSYQQFSGNPILNPLVPLKIVYEFLVLICGTAVLAHQSELDQIRSALLAGDQAFAQEFVERMLAKEYAPFHGICFQGNEPTATFQIRLFGKLVYRIRFRTVSLGCDPIVYTHHLKSGEYSFHEPKRV